MPLLVIVKPCYPTLSLREYRDQAWAMFQYLHDHDPEPWLADVPTDPDRGDWTLCFGGIQLFANVSDPAHRIHTSRNLGDSLVFAMQPRTNFDLVGGNHPKGRQVRKEIRARTERYEGQPVSSHLGVYGTSENREWLQMATKDGEADHDFPEVCPFKFRSDTANSK
jgi:FPC/CPF motif-containing protein YcgG